MSNRLYFNAVINKKIHMADTREFLSMWPLLKNFDACDLHPVRKKGVEHQTPSLAPTAVAFYITKTCFS
jgi:hypothetical protein